MTSILDQLTQEEFQDMMENVNASQLRVLLEAERKKNAELAAQVKQLRVEVRTAFISGMLSEMHHPSTVWNREKRADNYANQIYQVVKGGE